MIKLLGRVYHFSFLIYYPCSFYFHALILVLHWNCKLSPLNDTGKDQKSSTDFENIHTLRLTRVFDLVLSLAVTIPLITPVTDISWPGILEKECFDMLSNLGYGDFVRVFSSSRRYDRVYLGWFILDLVCRLFMMEASRWPVKAHYTFGSIGSCLSTGLQVYLSKCLDPYVTPRCTMCFFLQVFWLILASSSRHYLSESFVPSLPLFVLGSE